MALGVPGFVRIGAAIAGCALVAACTPEPGPTTTPTPTPSATVDATPSATPTETEIERQQRVDFEVAEDAYRINLAERQRLAQRGVARSTEVLRQTSRGAYLRFVLQELREIEDQGWHIEGAVKVVGVARGGWQANRLSLQSCEDGSGVRLLDKEDKDVTPRGEDSLFVQDLTVEREGSRWKVADVRSKRVAAFSGAACGQ